MSLPARKTVHGTLWLTAAKIVFIVTSYAIQFLLPRFLGSAEHFGEFASSTSKHCYRQLRYLCVLRRRAQRHASIFVASQTRHGLFYFAHSGRFRRRITGLSRLRFGLGHERRKPGHHAARADLCATENN